MHKTDLILCFVNSNEEEKLGNEQVDAQVLVDSVAVRLEPSQEAEGGDADGQTHKRDDNAHPGDDKQDELVHSPLVLRVQDER